MTFDPVTFDPAGSYSDGPEQSLVDAKALDSIESDLASVEVALARLDEGTYGTCVACERPISDSLLRDEPTVLHCPDHLALIQS